MTNQYWCMIMAFTDLPHLKNPSTAVAVFIIAFVADTSVSPRGAASATEVTPMSRMHDQDTNSSCQGAPIASCDCCFYDNRWWHTVESLHFLVRIAESSISLNNDHILAAAAAAHNFQLALPVSLRCAGHSEHSHPRLQLLDGTVARSYMIQTNSCGTDREHSYICL